MQIPQSHSFTGALLKNGTNLVIIRLSLGAQSQQDIPRFGLAHVVKNHFTGGYRTNTYTH